MKNKAVRIAVSAMLCAVMSAALYLACLAGTVSWSAVILSSLIIAFAVIEIGGIYPILMWAAVSVICFFILPDKLTALEFIIFGGIYPIIKSYFEKCPAPLAWMFKVMYFICALAGGYLLMTYVFSLSLTMSVGFVYFAIGTVLCVLYDILLTLLISVYIVKWKKRLKIRGWRGGEVK